MRGGAAAVASSADPPADGHHLVGSGLQRARGAVLRPLWRLFSRVDAGRGDRHSRRRRGAHRHGGDRTRRNHSLPAAELHGHRRDCSNRFLAFLVRTMRAAGTKKHTAAGKLIALAITAVAVAVAGYAWRRSVIHPSTDDATIDADIVHVAPEVGG